MAGEGWGGGVEDGGEKREREKAEGGSPDHSFCVEINLSYKPGEVHQECSGKGCAALTLEPLASTRLY